MPDDAKVIPIYDETAAIACTISNAEIPERVELVERLRASMSHIDRTGTGLLLHFPDDPAVRADLATFVLDEQRCCQFWGFEVVAGHGRVALRWDGPPAVATLFEQLLRYFTSDAPMSMLDGLL